MIPSPPSKLVNKTTSFNSLKLNTVLPTLHEQLPSQTALVTLPSILQHIQYKHCIFQSSLKSNQVPNTETKHLPDERKNKVHCHPQVKKFLLSGVISS